MKKWTRRLSISGVTLLGLLIALAVIGYVLIRGTPDWYQPAAMSEEQQRAAAQRATSKLIELQNAAAQARANERIAERRNATTAPAGSVTVTFTDDEINAFFKEWSVFQSVRAGYQKFMSDPHIVLKDGRLILAGRLHDVDAVTSAHFEPTIDEKGKLNLKLARVLAGKLPLPDAAFQKYQKRAADGVARRLPWWRRTAAMDSTGVPNSSAVSASMAQLLVDVFNNQPTEPVLFVPLIDGGKTVPVKLCAMKIEDHSLTLTVQPMTAQERADLLRRIRGDASAAAQ